MSEDTPANPVLVEPKKSVRDNALQDTGQANEITAAERLIGTIQADFALAIALGEIGFDEKEITRGAGLQGDAQDKFTRRQTALSIAGQDKAERDRLATVVEEEFSSYRQTVQALYKGVDRTTLGASGQIPADIEVFATTARTAYAAAQQEPFAGKLATRGFKPARAAAALAMLTEFTTANTKSKASQKAAEAATRERNAAVKAMNAWVAELRKVAKANLKKKPALLALLKE